jgi:hypothetical protein
MRLAATVGICLALCAVVAPSALAGPQYFTKSVVGATAQNVTFSEAGGEAILEGKTSKLSIRCATSTGIGEVTGATTSLHNYVVLHSCADAGTPCENAGPGEIDMGPLKGELGAISATAAGVRLSPETGSAITQFQCFGGGVLVTVGGSVIGRLSAGGAARDTLGESRLWSSVNLTFLQRGGLERYTHFLTGPSEQLLSAVSEYSTEKGEYLTHQELGAQALVETLTTTPAGNLGFTL